jgi:prepilin-type N-terminal cleavage/methylation domain-containing protein/prepilin-type processing-associated H-X9-DG protein
MAASSGSRRLNAFTLVEVLVVIAIIGILAAMLLPALTTTPDRSKQAGCANNLRQLALSVMMYSADNDGKLPPNIPLLDQYKGPWVSGNMKNIYDATNVMLIRQGLLFPYAGQPALYHCPSDRSQSSGQLRVRSYSMNSWMGDRYMNSIAGESLYRTFVRESELAGAGPSRLWTLIDEHEASIDDGWFLVTMDDTRPFASFPATRHSRGYDLNFADGHVEVYKLRDPNSLGSGTANVQLSATNSDWVRLKQATTIR